MECSSTTTLAAAAVTQLSRSSLHDMGRSCVSPRASSPHLTAERTGSPPPCRSRSSEGMSASSSSSQSPAIFLSSSHAASPSSSTPSVPSLSSTMAGSSPMSENSPNASTGGFVSVSTACSTLGGEETAATAPESGNAGGGSARGLGRAIEAPRRVTVPARATHTFQIAGGSSSVSGGTTATSLAHRRSCKKRHSAGGYLSGRGGAMAAAAAEAAAVAKEKGGPMWSSDDFQRSGAGGSSGCGTSRLRGGEGVGGDTFEDVEWNLLSRAIEGVLDDGARVHVRSMREDQKAALRAVLTLKLHALQAQVQQIGKLLAAVTVQAGGGTWIDGSDLLVFFPAAASLLYPSLRETPKPVIPPPPPPPPPGIPPPRPHHNPPSTNGVTRTASPPPGMRTLSRRDSPAVLGSSESFGQTPSCNRGGDSEAEASQYLAFLSNAASHGPPRNSRPSEGRSGEQQGVQQGDSPAASEVLPFQRRNNTRSRTAPAYTLDNLASLISLICEDASLTPSPPPGFSELDLRPTDDSGTSCLPTNGSVGHPLFSRASPNPVCTSSPREGGFHVNNCSDMASLLESLTSPGTAELRDRRVRFDEVNFREAANARSLSPGASDLLARDFLFSSAATAAAAAAAASLKTNEDNGVHVKSSSSSGSPGTCDSERGEGMVGGETGSGISSNGGTTSSPGSSAASLWDQLAGVSGGGTMSSSALVGSSGSGGVRRGEGLPDWGGKSDQGGAGADAWDALTNTRPGGEGPSHEVGAGGEVLYRRSQRRTATLPSNTANVQHRAMDIQCLLHLQGRCKPCAFYYNRKGCRNGEACEFCHHEVHSKLTLKQWKKQQHKLSKQGRTGLPCEEDCAAVVAAAAACCNGSGTPTGNSEMGAGSSFGSGRLRGRLGSGGDLDPAMVRSLFGRGDLSSSLSALSLIDRPASLLSGGGSRSGEKLGVGGGPDGSPASPTEELRAAIVAAETARATVVAAAKAAASAVTGGVDPGKYATGYSNDSADRVRSNEHVTVVPPSIFADFGRQA